MSNPPSTAHRSADDRRRRAAEEVASYLSTGDYDAEGWREYPGDSVVESMSAHAHALRHALIERVAQLEHGCQPPEFPAAYASVGYLRHKLRPMVCGLFAPDESASVLDLVVGSVVFLTRGEVHRILRETMWRCTAWNVASIWLDSIDARPLSESAPALLGLSEGTSCLVSLRYFHDLENDPFADYVVHEVAHLFHNNKRRYVGLPEHGRCEWMLDIDFRRRELFAHACEFFSRISARARGPKERLREIEEFAPRANSFAEEFEPAEFLDVLREAARARNGWRRILQRCRTSPRSKANLLRRSSRSPGSQTKPAGAAGDEAPGS